MKKVLFVLGFAMCATFAMAQTNHAVATLGNPGQPHKAAINPTVKEQAADYKASIFTKDDDIVLASFDFDASNMTGINYGSACKVNAGDMIDGQAVSATNAHVRPEPENYWFRVPDSASFVVTGGTYDINYHGVWGSRNFICRYMGARNGITDDNGFMLVSLTEYNGNNQAINTYFTLPSVNLNNAALVDVQWKQAYAKYYDKCYIDYTIGGNWYSMEVNVTGIDISVNGTTGYGARVATLPVAALDQTSINLRFRIFATGAQNAYGYFWAVDDVKVVASASPARWSFSGIGYLNGFYGILPQGFQVPLSYVMSVRNRGIEDINSVSMSMTHIGDAEPFITRAQSNLPWGDFNHFFTLRFNESGFMHPTADFIDSSFYHAVPDYYSYYETDDAFLAAHNYGRVSLPTTTTGKNQFAISVNGTATSNTLSRTFDTVAYTVSGYQDVNAAYGRTVPGYRWSNDNGVVPGGSEWSYQFSSGDADRSGYVTTEGTHQYEKEYQMYTRFNTPSNVPEGWVFRGVEYVTSTKLTSDQVNGLMITPFMMKMHNFGTVDSIDCSFADVVTGLSGDERIVIGPNSAPQYMEDNYTYYTPDMDQYVVNVLFPEQPAIEPNSMYIMGYINAEGGPFALASTAYAYQNTDSTTMSYLNEPDLADYYLQFTPADKVYDAWAYDPIQGSRNDTSSHTIFGWNIDEYPMVRLIVGPRMQIPHYDIEFGCEVEDTNYTVYRNGYGLMCGVTDDVAEGSSPSYYIIPGRFDEMQYTDENENYIVSEDFDYEPHMVIDAIVLTDASGNQEVITDFENDDRIGIIDYTFYWDGHTPDDGPANEWAPALVRNYYSFTLRNVQQNYTISAQTSYQPLGISNVEDFVNMTLAPNPATSQVRINVSGFAGKAECSILDMSGRVVYSTDITAGESVINLNNVPAGAYFVRVTSNNFSKVEKLIVR